MLLHTQCGGLYCRQLRLPCDKTRTIITMERKRLGSVNGGCVQVDRCIYVFRKMISFNELNLKINISTINGIMWIGTRWTASHQEHSMESSLGLRIKHRNSRRRHQSDAARALTRGQNVHSMRQKRRAPCSHIERFVGPALDREQSEA
jgi:hypothetical protein